MKFFYGILKKLIGNGLGKYLVYAFGEIILVVIGILLAISINSYYQKESEQKKTKEVTKEIYNQMVTDSLKISNYINYLGKLKEAIIYYRLPKDKRKQVRNPIKKVSKLNLFIDRDNDLLDISDLVSTQIQSFDFSSTNYSQILYNIQTDYSLGLKSIQNQAQQILNKNSAFNQTLTKYDWYIKFSAEINCANDCIDFIVNSEEFNEQLATFSYEKTFIYRIRIEEFQQKLRKNILDLEAVLR